MEYSRPGPTQRDRQRIRDRLMGQTQPNAATQVVKTPPPSVTTVPTTAPQAAAILPGSTPSTAPKTNPPPLTPQQEAVARANRQARERALHAKTLAAEEAAASAKAEEDKELSDDELLDRPKETP